MSDAPRPMPVTIERSGNAIVAHVQLKLLDDQELRAIGDSIDDAATTDQIAVVVIDLSHVQILPSLALGMLVRIATRCREREQALKVAGSQPQILNVFHITRLDRVLDLVDSVDAALA